MSLSQLRTFIEVYRRRSLSDGARALGITQPAASQHIASLEAQIGHPLFGRHSRGVHPTAIADDLAASVGGSLDTAEAARPVCRQHRVIADLQLAVRHSSRLHVRVDDPALAGIAVDPDGCSGESTPGRSPP